MHLPANLRIEGSTILHELRVGWRDFWARTWLWAIVLQFGVVNAFQNGAVMVLGPGVAKAHLGGPAAWGAILTATSAGLVLGVPDAALAATADPARRDARRLSVRAAAARARGPAPLPVVIVAAFAAGFSIEIFGVLWDTSMQQEIPQESLSPYAYDALGSLALTPLALAGLGPIAGASGAAPRSSVQPSSSSARPCPCSSPATSARWSSDPRSSGSRPSRVSPAARCRPRPGRAPSRRSRRCSRARAA